MKFEQAIELMGEGKASFVNSVIPSHNGWLVNHGEQWGILFNNETELTVLPPFVTSKDQAGQYLAAIAPIHHAAIELGKQQIRDQFSDLMGLKPQDAAPAQQIVNEVSVLLRRLMPQPQVVAPPVSRSEEPGVLEEDLMPQATRSHQSFSRAEVTAILSRSYKGTETSDEQLAELFGRSKASIATARKEFLKRAKSGAEKGSRSSGHNMRKYDADQIELILTGIKNGIRLTDEEILTELGINKSKLTAIKTYYKGKVLKGQRA